MSLREQMLKAGLVSEEKAKRAESSARNNAHKLKKDKKLAAAEQQRRQQEQRRRAAEDAEKKERDRQLNRRRETEKQRREQLARIHQLIESNRLNEPDAEVRFNFCPDGRRIRFVRVTPQQQRRLATGAIGIVRNDTDPFDFPLIPREAALTIAQLCPDCLLLLNAPGAGSDDDVAVQCKE